MEDNLQLVHADSTQYLLSLPADKRPDVIVRHFPPRLDLHLT
jgi:hypothetical protein